MRRTFANRGRVPGEWGERTDAALLRWIAGFSFLPVPSLHASLLAAALVAGLPALAEAQGPAAPDSAAAAAARQVDIGEQWFQSVCIQCHATGGLANADFRHNWSGRNAFDLLERIRSTMPQNRPGTLTQGTYVSIVAYLIKLNGMRVTTRLVSTDSSALAAIRLTFPASPAATPR